MPKTKFVKDIQEGEQVRDLFLVSSKAVLSSNSGKPYINLSRRDRTGQVECRVWDRAEEIAKRFDRDDIVEATGSAIQYQGRGQRKVQDVRRGGGGGRGIGRPPGGPGGSSRAPGRRRRLAVSGRPRGGRPCTTTTSGGSWSIRSRSPRSAVSCPGITKGGTPTC